MKMDIIKPQKKSFGDLRKIDNLQEEIIENEEIENVAIENYNQSSNFNDITIKKAIIKNTEIINCNLEKILLWILNLTIVIFLIRFLTIVVL